MKEKTPFKKRIILLFIILNYLAGNFILFLLLPIKLPVPRTENLNAQTIRISYKGGCTCTGPLTCVVKGSEYITTEYDWKNPYIKLEGNTPASVLDSIEHEINEFTVYGKVTGATNSYSENEVFPVFHVDNWDTAEYIPIIFARIKLTIIQIIIFSIFIIILADCLFLILFIIKKVVKSL